MGTTPSNSQDRVRRDEVVRPRWKADTFHSVKYKKINEQREHSEVEISSCDAAVVHPPPMPEAIKPTKRGEIEEPQQYTLGSCDISQVPSHLSEAITTAHGELSYPEEDTLGSNDAAVEFDPKFKTCVKYYRMQSHQKIGTEQVCVPIYFSCGLYISCWICPLKNAMQAINKAAPGLYLHRVNDAVAAKIIVVCNIEDGCLTEGNISSDGNVKISLDIFPFIYNKNGTALHELMHALGFDHEHQRRDGKRYFNYDTSQVEDPPQYEVSDKVIGLSRFDPHSIMMYPLCEALKPKPEGDTVWKTKVGNRRCQVLSELDKVCLNILHPPVVHEQDEQDEHDEGYNPHESSETGLMYCGRENCVQAGDGRCGPVKGANCPACRVLKTEKSEEIKGLGKWQGWTGLVYCGKPKPSSTPGPSDGDGICGPDQGEPCTECGKLIGYYDDSPEDQDEMQ